MLLPGPPYASLTLLTAAPLSLSILVGGGLVLLPAPPLAHLQLRHPAVSVCPVVGGERGGVLIPGPLCTPPTLMYLSVMVGRDGVVTR